MSFAVQRTVGNEANKALPTHCWTIGWISDMSEILIGCCQAVTQFDNRTVHCEHINFELRL